MLLSLASLGYFHVSSREEMRTFINLATVPITEEVKIMEAMYKDENGALWPLAEKMRRTLNETGRVLRARQLSSLGQFILKATTHVSFKQSAIELVKCLVETFKAFEDTAELEDKFNRKANQLAVDLFVRFSKEDERFNFSDIDLIPVNADSKMVYILRLLGLLQINEGTRRLIDDKGQELKAGSTVEIGLRQSCIDSSEVLLKQLQNEMPKLSPYQLDAALRIGLLETKVIDEINTISEHLTNTEHY